MARGALAVKLSDNRLDQLGDNLRSKRREQGLTLQDVADGAGLSVGFISQLERNLTSPSLTSLAAIARTLDADLTDILAMPDGDSPATRAGERRNFALDGTRSSFERISANFPGRTLRAVVEHKQPGVCGVASRHEGEELHYVLQGSITIKLDGEPHVLGAGDSIHFKSNQLHSSWNHTSEVATVLVIVTMDIFGDDVGSSETERPRRPLAGADSPRTQPTKGAKQ